MTSEDEKEIIPLADTFVLAAVNIRNQWQANPANHSATADVETFLDTFIEHVEQEFYTLLDSFQENK